jgi:integrase
MPLKLVRRPRSPYWYIRGSIRGISVDESTGLGDRREAEDQLALRAAEITKRSIHGDPATRTFAEAALSYMEAGGEKTHMAPLIKHMGRVVLARIGQAEIDEAAKKLKPRASPSTLNRQIYTPVAAVLHHAARKKWCDKPVIARPAQPKGRVRWISYDEAELLIGAAAEHIRPLVIFLLCTGARLSEALYLDWREVDLGAAQVVFHDTKNGDSRGVPLHPRAVAALAGLQWDRKGAVFRRPAGKIKKTGRLWLPYEDREGAGGGQIKTAWSGMLRRSGITNFTPHDCRHTWATWHYRENRDLAQLMELGGWKSADMVLRYAHVNTSHLAGSIGRVWGLDGKPSPSEAPKRPEDMAKTA